jgi:hypothetical protein
MESFDAHMKGIVFWGAHSGFYSHYDLMLESYCLALSLQLEIIWLLHVGCAWLGYVKIDRLPGVIDDCLECLMLFLSWPEMYCESTGAACGHGFNYDGDGDEGEEEDDDDVG